MALALRPLRTAQFTWVQSQTLATPFFTATRASMIVAQLALRRFLPAYALALPVSSHLGLPSISSILAGIWESILRAVPKKKTSHMKKRHRQMAGKALKDVNALCRCPACGQTKRMHYLCPHCTAKLQSIMRDKPVNSEPS